MGRAMEYGLVALGLLRVMKHVCGCAECGRCADCLMVDERAALKRLFATNPTLEPTEALATIFRSREGGQGLVVLGAG